LTLFAAKIAAGTLAKLRRRRFTLAWRTPRKRDCEVIERTLCDRLEREARTGATLSELEAEIDREARLLTDVEREEAWLYAWALKRHEERRLLGSGWEEETGYGRAGDTGAG
jgi:thiamine pyrophosphate-dependent acetolactate synthase large subunit-like protein